jgi:hypothetical protein
MDSETDWEVGESIRSQDLGSSTVTPLDNLFISGPVVIDAVIVNTPQILISFAYLFYNSIFTSRLAAYEYSNFARTRKAFRVSHPQGFQRSTL